ncbi:unnamed protein product [Brassica rapa]|uniref:Aspartic peptidase DDI1-type domain-containing protein n=1 Tax=Brassica campestris TaxID=3711 RepID=A0A3P6AMK7_BRACM|nr:unnamed protein product [Brassica rapa]VDC90279.1 unnamed protein product [Brassica rapa]
MKYHVNVITGGDFWQVVKEEKLQERDFKVEILLSFGGSHWCRSTPSHEHRSTKVIQNRSTSSLEHRSTTPTESTASCNAVRIMTHKDFAAKHPHPLSPVYTAIDRQPPAPIYRRVPLTYRVQMPMIDVERLNALRPKPKPSKNSLETVRTPSDDGVDPMEVDRTEEDITRMFCEAREQMRKNITLKKKSDPGQFAIPCTVKGIEFPHALCDAGASVSILPRIKIMVDHMGLQVQRSKELFIFRNSGAIVRDVEVQIGNVLVPVDFHVLDI